VTGLNVEGAGTRWENKVWEDDGSEVPPED
jgi:hypothetical protein